MRSCMSVGNRDGLRRRGGLTLAAAVVTVACLFVGNVLPAAGSTIWVEAELFSHMGGWSVDSQFIDQMGSSYLLAAGMCEPVADAHTDVTVKNAGRYTLWVRCRNWLVKHSPGRFEVKVGPKASRIVFGAQSDPHWTWVEGGAFDLSAGKHRLALHDLTGEYGRCDALVLTSDQGFRPPKDGAELERVRRSLSGVRRTVEDRGSFDVVVVGGGVAGSCAAMSSARHGAKTVLIQDRPVLGGNTSDEVRVWVQGAAGGRLNNAREGALVEEMLLLAKAEGSESKALAKMVRDMPNLTVCLRTRAQRARCGTPGHIDAVEAVHVVTGERSVFSGKLFIDCTGDGVIGASAGAIYRVGREGKDEFKESIAPDKPDRKTLGSSLLWDLENTRKPTPFVAPKWALEFPSCKDLPHRGHQPPVKGHWWIEYGGGTPPPDLRDIVDDPNQLNTITDAEEIRDYLLRALYGVWDHIKNRCDRKPMATNHRLTWVGHVAGKRESRRLIGDYIMVENDILSARVFPDQVAYGGWSIDLHPPQGIHDPGEPALHHFFDKPYSIPLRSLYSKNIDNLMMAGRDVSVSHVALGTVRVMGTCGLMGQGVGTAAALCIKHDCLPREIAKLYVRELQRLLLKDDGYLIGMANEDPADLARKAKVSASSTQTVHVSKPDIAGRRTKWSVPGHRCSASAQIASTAFACTSSPR